MTRNPTRIAVDQLYEAYARGDGERVAAMIDDDIDWIIHGPVQVFPFEGPRKGKAEVLDVLAATGRRSSSSRATARR
jgi:ketosteroid isomerase-like protein